MRTSHWVAVEIASLVGFGTAHPASLVTGLATPKIDTHAHVYPDFYREAVIEAGWVPGPDGNPAPPAWNVSMHLAFMETNNVEKSIVSCSSPGTNLYPNDTTAGIALTKRFNDFTAGLKHQYPDKYGFFASLPLPDIEATLEEIDRALDVLNADGFVFLSNFAGLYHGDPKLKPVYDKLNARKAVIFIHPTIPCPASTPKAVVGTERLDYVAPLMGAYHAPTLEFIFDTTRTVSDIIMTGTATTYTNLKWIIPHCGSAIPSVLDRFVRIASLLGAKVGSDRTSVPFSVANATALLQKQFWFDLAGFAMGNQIYDMKRLFGPEKFLYGSDVPFTAPAGAVELTDEMNTTLPELFSDGEISAIYRGNAVGLLGL
ncbi:uncharacterized protein Z518_06662 [Rhinocladiella mackenziei CBS 650.93]|uniref:6-methylsalicylate decarboxylase n=1 Tax=Rhinocladiella mackenziei CBS 650.93 TaxID=1442369 RepID=A0A0D2FMB1_9EURO|nr:uncharacterized protein Z518_06662 [Rhinocladiella mackenziei CBS 650.93]KIX03112.1 hypothetical protein Z518_06662 [Rhinocladiella mackenziei CBS 650.93]